MKAVQLCGLWVVFKFSSATSTDQATQDTHVRYSAISIFGVMILLVGNTYFAKTSAKTQ